LKLDKLLVGTLAVVLVAGLGSPAFAGQSDTVSPIDQVTLETLFEPLTISEADDVIFDNGGMPDVDGGNPRIDQTLTVADDFILNEDAVITDFHFVLDTFFESTGDFTGTIEYLIFSDNGGEPGNILASGILTDLDFDQINDRFATVWYFLDVPFEAEGGVTYWFGLHTDFPNYAWSTTDAGQGSQGCQTFDDPPTGGWFCSFNLWFQITGHPPDVVGGEFLPIDSTALLLAGLQTSAIWMLPVLAGAAGVGAFYIKTRMNKE